MYLFISPPPQNWHPTRPANRQTFFYVSLWLGDGDRCPFSAPTVIRVSHTNFRWKWPILNHNRCEEKRGECWSTVGAPAQNDSRNFLTVREKKWEFQLLLDTWIWRPGRSSLELSTPDSTHTPLLAPNLLPSTASHEQVQLLVYQRSKMNQIF